MSDETITGSNPDPFKTILADPRYRRYPKYAKQVDSARSVAWIAEYPSKWLEHIFRNLHVEYAKERFRDHVVYTDFTGPEMKFGAVSPENWKVVTPDGRETENAFDRKIWSVWTSKNKQSDGQAFVVDMGQMESISRIAFLAGGFHPRDNPSGYEVQVSTDGEKWRRVAVNKFFYRGGIFWDGKTVKADLSGLALSVFKPVAARFVKISIFGQSRYCWSIAELFIYRPEPNDTEQHDRYNQYISASRGLKNKGDFAGAASALFKAILLDPDRHEAHVRFEEIVLNSKMDPVLWLMSQSDESEGSDALRYVEEAYALCPGNIVVAGKYIKKLKENGHAEQADALRAVIEESFVPETACGIDFGPVSFLGFTLENKELSAGDRLDITYFWKVQYRPDRNWIVFIHIYKNGTVIYDDHLLVEKQKPTRMWIQGDILVDRRAVTIPSDALPGVYTIAIGLWDPETGTRLKCKENGPAC